MGKVRIGKIVGVSGFGPWPSMFTVSIEQLRTGAVFDINVQNTQSWHPLGEVADVEREKRGLPTGQFAGAQIDLEGIKVMFVEDADDMGLVGTVIHYDVWRQMLKDKEAERENAAV